MPRLHVIEPASAEGKAAEALEMARRDFGGTPNIIKGLANSPAALKAFLALHRIQREGMLTEAQRNTVCLTVCQSFASSYALAASCLLAERAGMSPNEIQAVRSGKPTEQQFHELVKFSSAVLASSGAVSDADLQAFRAAGFTDGHIAEVIAAIAESLFAVFFERLHQPDLDLPQPANLA